MPKTTDKRQLESKTKFTGMKIKARNGQMMKCIEYINSKNLTVRFEDGTIRYNVYRCSFLKGSVQNPNCLCTNTNKTKIEQAKKKYIGMKVRAKNGMMMECIDYADANNITIRFENGDIRTNIGCTEFKTGQVREDKKRKYIGIKVRAKNGQIMECIDYIKSNNITVKFEDNTVVYNLQVKPFLEGNVRNPNRPHPLIKRNERLNKQFTLKNGETVRVIEYETYKNVTVESSDGSISKTTWYNLTHGTVAGATYPSRKNHFGEKYSSPYGIYCEITGLTEQSYELTWEDGYKSTSELKSIQNKTARHPALKKDKKIAFPYRGYICRFVFDNGSGYYYACSCPKCGFDQILSAKEMLKLHKCKNIRKS